MLTFAPKVSAKRLCSWLISALSIGLGAIIACNSPAKVCLTNFSVARTDNWYCATLCASSICCLPCNANKARACPISNLPSSNKTLHWLSNSNKRNKLETAARERPTASAVCWWVKPNSWIKRFKACASSKAFKSSR